VREAIGSVARALSRTSAIVLDKSFDRGDRAALGTSVGVLQLLSARARPRRLLISAPPRHGTAHGHAFQQTDGR